MMWRSLRPSCNAAGTTSLVGRCPSMVVTHCQRCRLKPLVAVPPAAACNRWRGRRCRGGMDRIRCGAVESSSPSLQLPTAGRPPPCCWRSCRALNPKPCRVRQAAELKCRCRSGAPELSRCAAGPTAGRLVGGRCNRTRPPQPAPRAPPRSSCARQSFRESRLHVPAQPTMHHVPAQPSQQQQAGRRGGAITNQCGRTCSRGPRRRRGGR